MKNWQALRTLLAMILLLVAALLIIALLVDFDRADLLIPDPGTTAEGFVGAMAAHRYTGAIGQLSQELQEQLNSEDLYQVQEMIEAAHQGIGDVHVKGSAGQGDQTTARVRVTLGDHQEVEMDFPLKKEEGIWKVSSIDPLQAVVSQSSP